MDVARILPLGRVGCDLVLGIRRAGRAQVSAALEPCPYFFFF